MQRGAPADVSELDGSQACSFGLPRLPTLEELLADVAADERRDAELPPHLLAEVDQLAAGWAEHGEQTLADFEQMSKEHGIPFVGGEEAEPEVKWVTPKQAARIAGVTVEVMESAIKRRYIQHKLVDGVKRVRASQCEQLKRDYPRKEDRLFELGS